jgi:hypothetical protein
MTTTRSTRLRRALGLAAVPVLLLTAAACGDDDDEGSSGSSGGGDTSSFCADARAIDEAASDTDPSDTAAFEDAITAMQALDPPAEIAEDWNLMFESFAEASELSVEDLENMDEDAFAEAEAASDRVTAFMEEECGIEG